MFISKLLQKVIAKSYYKVRQLRQPFISKWGKRYFKVRAKFISKWDSYFISVKPISNWGNNITRFKSVNFI